MQLSQTFQTEISARCTHYEREGVPLVWVLFGLQPQNDQIPQNVIDIIRRHRGNAFVIDREAVEAGYERRTIVLKCYLQHPHGGFDASRLVRLDELTFPKDSLPYFEDRVSKSLLGLIAERRLPCFDFLKTIERARAEIETDSPQRGALISALREISPDLSNWEPSPESEENAVLRLIACVFSIISKANRKEHVYGTRHPNIVAMLNTWLHVRQDIQRTALILGYLLRRTPLADLLSGTVGEHIARAEELMDGNLVLKGEPEWIVLSHLVPEIFDPVIRAELRYFSTLPAWAQEPFGTIVDIDAEEDSY